MYPGMKESQEAVVGAIERTADDSGVVGGFEEAVSGELPHDLNVVVVRRKAGGSDARRNRGRRVVVTRVCASMLTTIRECSRRRCFDPGESATSRGLKPGQQLRLLGGEFLLAEDSLITQFGKLLDGREDVRLTDRRSADGTL